MSFELLDSILNEAGVPSTTGKEVVKEDSDLYAGLDEMIEDAMREVLRETVMKSDASAETKLGQLEIVENAAFTQEQMSTFVENVLHPVLVLSDSFNLEEASERVSVPLELYETSILLARASGKYNETGTLYESIFGSAISEEVLAEELTKIFEENEYEDQEDQEELLDLAADIAENYDLRAIEPSIIDISEMVLQWNELHEAGLLPSIHELLTEEDKAKRFAGIRNVFGKAKKGVVSTGRSAAQTAKDISGYSDIKHARAMKKATPLGAHAGNKEWADAREKARKKLMGTGIAKAAVGTLAAAAAGVMAYRAFKNRKCKGLSGAEKTACMNKAYDEAIKAEKAKMTACSSASNPEKCKSKAAKRIAKWQAKKK